MSSELLDDYEEGTAQVVFRDSESSPNDMTMATNFATIAYTKKLAILFIAVVIF